MTSIDVNMVITFFVMIFALMNMAIFLFTRLIKLPEKVDIEELNFLLVVVFSILLTDLIVPLFMS